MIWQWVSNWIRHPLQLDNPIFVFAKLPFYLICQQHTQQTNAVANGFAQIRKGVCLLRGAISMCFTPDRNQVKMHSKNNDTTQVFRKTRVSRTRNTHFCEQPFSIEPHCLNIPLQHICVSCHDSNNADHLGKTLPTNSKIDKELQIICW